MAFLPDSETAIVRQFQGSVNAIDAYDIDPGHGLWSQNCDFIFNVSLFGSNAVQAATRRGSSLVVQNTYTTDGSILTIFSWYYSYGGVQSVIVGMYSAVNGLRFYIQSPSAITAVVIPVTGAAGVSVVTSGTRAYIAFFDATGRHAVSPGYVYGLYNGAYLSSPAADQLFSSPLTTATATVAVSQPGAGVITAGTHRIGYVFITRNGDAAQILNPVTVGTNPLIGPYPGLNAATFSPVSFTAADGVHNCRVTIDFLSIPSYLNPVFAPTTATVQIVMSSAANPAAYYLVPGAVGYVPNAPGNVVIDFSINDGDLVTGTNVTQNQNQLTAVNGVPPFSPSAIFSYSSRLGYVTIDQSGFPVVYFSDQNNYQSLTAAFHGVYLEGTQVPIQGVSLGVCYIASIAALYAVQDNGGLPATWTPPQRIDGSVGILAPSCMISTGGKILLASEKGLYIYRGGTFPQIPLSFWQTPDWSRINWLAPTQVQVVDDSLDKVIRVIAPLSVSITAASNTNPIQISTAILINNTPVAYPHLFQNGMSVTISNVPGNTNANGTFPITVTGDSTFTIPVAGNGNYISGSNGVAGTATPNSSNAEMAWAYPAGDNPGQTFYSLNAFTSYMPSSIATVRNLSTNKDETWYAPQSSNPGGLIRRVLPTDINPYRDVDMSGNPAAINSNYETSLLPGQQDENVTIHDYIGAHFRVVGNGAMNVSAYSLDHNPSLTVIPLASPLGLSVAPGIEYLMRWALRNEQQSISFGTNQIDAYFVMSIIRAYYTNSLPQR